MTNTTVNYTPNYTLSFHSLDSFQNKSLMTKIIEFIRDMFGLESDSDNFIRLVNEINDPYLTNSPIELLNELKKHTPTYLKKDIYFTIGYENNGRELKFVEVKYKDKSIRLDINDYELTTQDMAIIKELKLNVVQHFDEMGDDIFDEMGDNFSVEKMYRESRIKYEFNKIIDAYSEASEEGKDKYRLKVIYKDDRDHVEVDRLIVTNNGLSCLEVKPDASELKLIMEIIDGIINIENQFATCSYKKTTKTLIEIDKGLADFEKMNPDYLVSKRVNLVDKIYNNAKELGGVLQFNNIVRGIDSSTVKSNAFTGLDKCNFYTERIINILENIKNNKLDDEDKKFKIGQIKIYVALIKYKIRYQQSSNSNETIPYAEKVINNSVKEVSTLSLARKIELEGTISNIKELMEYCDDGDYLYIVNKHELLAQERKLIDNEAFNLLCYGVFNNKELSDQDINLTSEIEKLLVAYLGSPTLDKGNQDILKFSDELYDFNPNLFIPRDFLNEYAVANKKLTEEIKSSLNLSPHNSEGFRTKAMEFLDEIYAIKSSFLDDYMKCFDAQRMSESQDMLMVFKSILNRIEQNKTLDEDKKHTWLQQANERLLDEINPQIGIRAMISNQ